MEIYGLSHPETGEMRYVGKTEGSLAYRLTEHLWPSQLKNTTHKVAWIKQLLRYGLSPHIHSIQKLVPPASKEDLNAAEIYWIGFFRDQGCRLTNGTDGGDGCGGHVKTLEEIAKVVASRAGYRHSEQTRAKIAAAHRGVPGHKASPETRAKMSAASRGKPKTPEHRMRIGDAHRGKPKSPEQVAKMSANAKSQKCRRNLLGRFEPSESKNNEQ